jgi:hypothetical protein
MIDQKQLENVEYFSYAGGLIAGDATRTTEFKCRTAMAGAAVSKKRAVLTNRWSLNLSNKRVNCYFWSTALLGTETRTFRKVDQKYLESF